VDAYYKVFLLDFNPKELARSWYFLIKTSFAQLFFVLWAIYQSGGVTTGCTRSQEAISSPPPTPDTDFFSLPPPLH